MKAKNFEPIVARNPSVSLNLLIDELRLTAMMVEVMVADCRICVLIVVMAAAAPGILEFPGMKNAAADRIIVDALPMRLTMKKNRMNPDAVSIVFLVVCPIPGTSVKKGRVMLVAEIIAELGTVLVKFWMAD